MKSSLPAAAVLVGVLLLLVSFAWGILFPATRTWTEEKSKRMADLNGKGHLLSMQITEAKESPAAHKGRSLAELQKDYDSLQSEYSGLKADFGHARDSPKTTSTFLRWSGVAFVAAGALILFAKRE
jgi:hypothetical protein